MKRIFDITLAAILFTLFLPVVAVLAITVKMSSRGPVFYRGVRAGRAGRPFKMLKFRSMVQDAEKLGGPSTSGDDPRLTTIGRTMRRFKLDELPQLLNVLAGDMSFVGPRPEVLSEVALYTDEQRRILNLRPGITDWASIWNSNEERVLAGSADPHEAYKRLIQPTKLRLQMMYYENHSFLVDLRILSGTALKIMRPNWVPAELRSYPAPLSDSSAPLLRTSS